MTEKETRIPFFNTDIVIDESILMLRDEYGVAEAPLLYDPLEILSVTNSMKTEEYTQGIDWILKGNKIVLTENSRIFAFTKDELYPAEGIVGKSFPIPNGYILFSEGNFFIEKQIAVTYKCKNGQWKGVKPELADKTLRRSFKKLRDGERLNLVLYGDSISRGANATKELNIPPYQPDWGTMLYESLCERYGNNICYTNTSVGGKETNWAIENIEERVNEYNPDLLIIGFGMNDGGKSPELFEEKIRTMITLVRNKNPECEFILIATSLPNSLMTDPKACFWHNQEHFLSALKNIADDKSLSGIALANITDVHRELLSRKRFIDLTSNNVNHPNDFFYRCHAQFLSGMLID